jgi:hypothetical protein
LSEKPHNWVRLHKVELLQNWDLAKQAREPVRDVDDERDKPLSPAWGLADSKYIEVKA